MFPIASVLVFLGAQWRTSVGGGRRRRRTTRVVESEGLQWVRLPVGFCSKRHGTGCGCRIGLVVVGHRSVFLCLFLLAEVFYRSDGRWPLTMPVHIEGVLLVLVNVIVGVS